MNSDAFMSVPSFELLKLVCGILHFSNSVYKQSIHLMLIQEVLHGVHSIVQLFNHKISLTFARCRLNTGQFEALYLHCLDEVALLLSNDTSLVSGKLSWSS